MKCGFSKLATKQRVIFQIEVCQRLERNCDMFYAGVLYGLYVSHPAIDFVGKLIDQEGTSWLVKFQLSVSFYAHHCSKAWHLNQTYKGYDEF